jgi:hypothetical protein
VSIEESEGVKSVAELVAEEVSAWQTASKKLEESQ